MALKLELIKEHSKLTKECMTVLKEELGEYANQNYTRVDELTEKVREIEGQADDIKRAISNRWSKSRGTSNEESNALMLLKEMDNIPDYCEDVALLLEMRNTSVPMVLKDDFRAFVEEVYQSVVTLDKTIEMFHGRKKLICANCEFFVRMYEGSIMGYCEKIDDKTRGGVSGGYRSEDAVCEMEMAHQIYELVDEVSRREEAADVLDRKLRKAIFSENQGLGPIGTFHLFRIIEGIDAIANCAENAAFKLKTMV